MEVNGTRSREFFLKEGPPQGSAISPLLFLIFINDIRTDLHPDTIASLFADDTSIGRHGSQQDSLKNLLQEEVDKILEWADRWKMKINKDKTKALVISSSNADTSWDIGLRADDEVMETVNEFKFLGVTIDSGLRFNNHIKRIVDKCKNRVNIIKCMLWKDWGNSLEIQRTLYLQFIRSCLEYASSSWSPWISDTGLAKLERVQHESLRAATGLARTCQVDFLHLEANVEPLGSRFKKLDTIMYDKYARLPPSDSRKVLLENKNPPRLKTRHGWRHKTIENVNNTIKRDITSPPTPPWRSQPRLEVQYIQFVGRKADHKPEHLKQITMEKIQSMEPNLTIYTDGSTSGEQENGRVGVTIWNSNDNVLEEISQPSNGYAITKFHPTKQY